MTQLVTLADYADRARRRVRPDVWDFLAGGAGDEITLHANLAAFRRVGLRPRVLVDVADPDPSVQILGRRWAAPIGVDISRPYYSFRHVRVRAGVSPWLTSICWS